MATLFSQIEAIAAPVVKHYRDDVAVYDRDALSKFKPGDSALWGCYECGSHLAPLTYAAAMSDSQRLELTRHALNLFDAQVSVFGPQIATWYLLVADGEHVRPIDPERARRAFVDNINKLEASLKRKAA